MAAAGLLAGLVGLAAGCQKHGPSGPDGQPVVAQSAADLYQAQRFAEAKARAEFDYKTTSGPARRLAALTAGLSAHAMNQPAEATVWLEPLLSDPDPDISGRAAVSLGVIAESRGEHARAAELFTQASKQLEGDAAARAALRAGHAQTAMKKFAEASESYRAGVAAAQTPGVRQAIEPYTETGPFALQVGMFHSKANAERKAREVRSQAARLGLGAPQIAMVPAANGKAGYSVRIGRFINRHAAHMASESLATPSVVVSAQ